MGLKLIKSIFPVLLLLFTIAITACTSPLSEERITDLSLIKAQINIVQNPENKKINTVMVILEDKKGRRISNDSINIIVNGTSTTLQHRQGLYYSNESGYALSDVPVDDVYKLEIKLPDQQRYFLGSIDALAEESEDNITCESQGNFKEDFTIFWKDLKNIDELSLSVSVLQNNGPPNEKNYGYKPEKIIKINPEGYYTIPKSTYVTDSTMISGIEFDFRTTRQGKVNAGLAAGSYINISTLIEKYVNFEE